jgi:tRNA(Ile)-lysidine synthase
VLLAKFSEHIITNFPYLKGKKLLIAISGGLDSVVLTHLLFKQKFNLSLAHCNFDLREMDSNLDELFVKKLADQMNLTFFSKKFNTKQFAKKNNLSIQLAARNLRYGWFKNLLESEKLDFVLTAHHANDNIETFLINCIRGTGISGLTGIPLRNGNIIRVLLPFTRAEILQYAKENAITWREDLSNAELKYTRNKIRHQIIPLLKEINPNFLTSFNKTIQNLQMTRQIVEDTVNDLKQSIFSEEDEIQKINIEKLKKLKDPKAYLFELLKSYEFSEWNDINNLMDAQSGKQIVSKSHRIIKNRDFLLLSKRELNDKKEQQYLIKDSQTGLVKEDIKLKLIRSKFLDQNNVSEKTAFVDWDKLTFPLLVRKWQKGDYFYSLGMVGKKKLSKFFKDQKLSLIEKEKIWLLCSGDHVVWVIGKRLDDRFKITNQTKNILKIEQLQ